MSMPEDYAYDELIEHLSNQEPPPAYAKCGNCGRSMTPGELCDICAVCCCEVDDYAGATVASIHCPIHADEAA